LVERKIRDGKPRDKNPKGGKTYKREAIVNLRDWSEKQTCHKTAVKNDKSLTVSWRWGRKRDPLAGKAIISLKKLP